MPKIMPRFTSRLLPYALIAAPLLACGSLGCNGDAQRDAKLEQDRTQLQLISAERDRDNARAQLDQLKAQLDAATRDAQQAHSDLDDKTAKLQKANDDLAAAQTAQTNSHDDAMRKLVDANNALRQQLLDLQAKAMDATDQNLKLTAEIDRLRTQLAGKSAPTTDPNK